MELQGRRVTRNPQPSLSEQRRNRSKGTLSSSRRKLDDRAEDESKSGGFSGLEATGSGLTASGSRLSAAKGSRLPTAGSRVKATSGQFKFSAQHSSGREKSALPARTRSSPDQSSSQEKPTRMRRAKSWSYEVEEHFRLQNVGWRDLQEYQAAYGEPDRWESTFMIKCIRVKDTGFFTYWDADRECEDKHVPKVKLYEYACVSQGTSSGGNEERSDGPAQVEREMRKMSLEYQQPGNTMARRSNRESKV